MTQIQISPADMVLRSHQDAVLNLMDAYAADPMGNGQPLTEEVRDKLIDGLREHPTTYVLIAWMDEVPVGIAACFRGFSTFAAKPLLYVSDFYVVPQLRGNGLGRRILEHIEQEARATGCCKLTLEVQENNRRARQIYESFGFSQAVYVKEAGGSLSMSKKL